MSNKNPSSLKWCQNFEMIRPLGQKKIRVELARAPYHSKKPSQVDSTFLFLKQKCFLVKLCQFDFFEKILLKCQNICDQIT